MTEQKKPYLDTKPFKDIARVVSDIVAGQRKGSAITRPAGAKLGTAVDSFLETWNDLDDFSTIRLEKMEARDRAIQEKGLEEVRELLFHAWEDEASSQVLIPRMLQIAVMSGERLIAMQMAGESEQQIVLAGTLMGQLIQRAHFAGYIKRLADKQGIEPYSLGPAIGASVIAQLHGSLETAPDFLQRFDLLEGSDLSSDVQQRAAATLAYAIQQGQSGVVRPMEISALVAKHAFLPAPLESPYSELDPIKHAALIEQFHSADDRPKVDIRPLVAFASSSKGGSEVARIEGALELFRAIASMERIRSGSDSSAVSRLGLLQSSMESLRRIAQIVKEERTAHRQAEQRWKDIEKEMEFLAKQQAKNEGPVVYVFPDDFKAHEARGLYLQDAISKGVPLAYLMAELYDSRDMTFGPSERRFFERLIFYGARKYAANYAVEDDPRIQQIAEQGDEIRAEEVRAVLRRIELSLRENEDLEDSELKALGQTLLDESVQRGELQTFQVQGLEDSIERMITHVRAAEEIRFLTAVLAVDGKIPDEYVSLLTQLPHVKRLADQNLPETRMFNMYARNGQKMRELERHTRARWLRYRQQAPSGQDVAPVRLDSYDSELEVDNPMRIKGKPAFRSNLPKKKTRDYNRDSLGEREKPQKRYVKNRQ